MHKQRKKGEKNKEKRLLHNMQKRCIIYGTGAWQTGEIKSTKAYNEDTRQAKTHK